MRSSECGVWVGIAFFVVLDVAIHYLLAPVDAGSVDGQLDGGTDIHFI